MSSSVRPVWAGIVDDAAIFPPGNLGFHDALAAHHTRPDDGLVGSFVLKDTDLPLARGAHARLTVILTGGAGQVAGPFGLCRRLGLDAGAVAVALQDPDDLPGNARRVVAAVDAARDEGVLTDDTEVLVELPHSPTTAGWLAAADVVAESELRLKFRTGGLERPAFPSPTTLASWIEAALDRETPFTCTAGLHHAVAHTDGATGFDHHGFLNVLLATRASLEGDDAAAVLAERDSAALLDLFAAHGEDAMTRTRRWFTSFGTCSVADPYDDLVGLGLLEAGVA
ncbi:hypothetical protein [Nocardioides sp.]|uniref:hypothetical protein n=1 Tax=Nocardioides sp. TaxID=35761 RepID=UPI003D122766